MEKNLTIQRKTEIINACEKLYQTKGFREVTIKEISKETSFSRPSIYNYFETKEEIFIALLTREYDRWIDKLKKISSMDRTWDRETFAKALASTLENQEIMLKIQTMNLYEIEENSRVERLEEYKRSFYQAMLTIDDCLISYKNDIDESAKINFRYAFFPFLYGIYSYAHPTEKQLTAMNRVGIPYTEMTIYELAWHCIWKLLP
ncbi:TetR family transcriptional regulator [Erysipelotrichaceae bacterium HCN-30851]